MRSKWCSSIAALLAVALLGACGTDDAAGESSVPARGTTEPSTTSGPTTPSTTSAETTPTSPTRTELPADGLVFRWTTRWWDPMLAAFGAPGADLAVYADGTVIGTSTVDFEVRPMIWPYVTGTIPVAEVEVLLAAAAAAGLLESPGMVDGNDAMVGAPVTFVDVRTAAGTARHRVHALQTPPVADTPYLATLRDFVDQLREATWEALDPTSAPFLESDQVAVIASRLAPPPERAVADWDGAFPLAEAVPCTVTGDAATIAMLHQHIAGDFFSDGDTTYSVTAQQLLPGESACFDVQPGQPGQPGQPDDVASPVIRITTQPLFPVEPPFVGAGPASVVFADGLVLAPSNVSFAAAPWAWPYDTGTVTPEQVAALLDLAVELRLGTVAAPMPRFDVTDAPVTTFLLDLGDGPVVHQVEALDSPPADDPTGYYARLAEFRDAVRALVDDHVEVGEFYRPTHWMVVSAPDDGPGTASEWRGPVPLDELTECTVVAGDAWLDLFGTGNAGGGARYADAGVDYRLAVRVAFPDETC